MSDPGHSPPASREFVFRSIQLLMLLDIAIGGALAFLGLFVLDFPGLAIAGAFLACIVRQSRRAIRNAGAPRRRYEGRTAQPTRPAPMIVSARAA